MSKINIALLAGGNSSERGISLQSAKRVELALDSAKYNVYLIDVEGLSWKYTDAENHEYQVDKNDFSLTVKDGRVAFDYAWIVIHGTPGEDGQMQGYLDMIGVSYSSPKLSSMVVTFDKALCKKSVAAAGLPLAKQALISSGECADPAKLVAELGLPMFVKPTASGSSFGVTKVRAEQDIQAAIQAARKESPDVLIEEFIEGREVSCGIFMTVNEEILLPVTEIVSKTDFFDYEAKYTPGFSEEITPADLETQTLKVLNDMTRRAYKACGCRGLVRIDFIIKNGRPYFIEVNSVPGMSGGSIIPQQAAVAGIELGVLFDKIIADTYRPRK